MKISLRPLAAFSAILCVWPAAAWADTSSSVESWEIQTGQQYYMEFMQRGEVVPPQSPLYRALDSIGDTIAVVADRRYFAPFRFVLLDDQTPNAFSMPGGNVYVTTGLMSLLKNRDELAGIICHEMNHDIHHDMYAVFEATQDGRSPQDPEMTAYERAAETRADRAGAYLCAKAGFNPWGMVWTFRRYSRAAGASSSGGSDHPSDARREADLAALFRSDKATFGKFHDNIASATPLASPQLAQRQYSPYQQYPHPQQYAQQPYSQSPQQPYSQYPQHPYSQYPQQPYLQYPQQPYAQYPQQPYAQYPQQPYTQYPQQPYTQYPQQPYTQYPQQQPQYPPPPPPCYPGC